MFDERWSADVLDVTSTLRSLLESRCPESVVRDAEATDSGWSPKLHEQLSEFGLYELPNDAELLAAVAMEIGRSLAPVPWPEVAAVRAVLGVDQGAYALEGHSPAGPTEAVIRVPSGLALVPNSGPHERSSGGDVLVRVQPSGVQAAWDDTSAELLASTMRLLGAARLVGASSKMLEIGVAYAKERHAFGRPIGSYQAVSHKLVEAAIEVEGADLLVRKTAWLARSNDHGAPPTLFGLLVWAITVESARAVASIVHQCMGGFGATMEYPAQLYSRRIRSWALRLGRPCDAFRAVGESILDPAQRDSVSGLWHHDVGIALPRWARELDRIA